MGTNLETPEHAEALEKMREEWKAELTAVKEENAHLKGRIVQITAAPPATPPAAPREPEPAQKVYTRAELRRAVEKEVITEDDMFDILDAQAKRETQQLVEQSQAQSQAVAQVDAQLATYAESHPELLDNTSELFASCDKEYKSLVAMGYPATEAIDRKRLELMAVRAVVGPAQRIDETTREKRETDQQVGGGGGSEEEIAGAPNKLSNRLKAHYKQQIDKGVYSGWEDPALTKELEYVR